VADVIQGTVSGFYESLATLQEYTPSP
jgi:hypothetical protein